MIWCCRESFSCPCREVPCHDFGRARSGPASLFDCAKHNTAGGRHHGLLKAKLEALDGQKAARVGERFCSKARLQLRACFCVGGTELRFIVGSPHHSERNRISEDPLTVFVDNHTHQKHSTTRPGQFSLERCISTCQYGIRPAKRGHPEIAGSEWRPFKVASVSCLPRAHTPEACEVYASSRCQTIIKRPLHFQCGCRISFRRGLFLLQVQG